MALRCPGCKTVHEFPPGKAPVCTTCGFTGPVAEHQMTLRAPELERRPPSSGKRRLPVEVRRPPLGSDLPPDIQRIVEGRKRTVEPRLEGTHPMEEPARAHYLMAADEHVQDALGRPGEPGRDNIVLTDRRIHASMWRREGTTRWAADVRSVRSIDVGPRRRPAALAAGIAAVAAGGLGLATAFAGWALAAVATPIAAGLAVLSLATLMLGVHRTVASHGTAFHLDLGARRCTIDLRGVPAERAAAFATVVLMEKERHEARPAGNAFPTASVDAHVGVQQVRPARPRRG